MSLVCITRENGVWKKYTPTLDEVKEIEKGIEDAEKINKRTYFQIFLNHLSYGVGAAVGMLAVIGAYKVSELVMTLFQPAFKGVAIVELLGGPPSVLIGAVIGGCVGFAIFNMLMHKNHNRILRT